MTAAISNPASFRAEARFQRVCAICGASGRWHPHHAVPRRLLKRMHLPEWDTRNALRLCVHCHMQFEWAGPGKVAIPVGKLTDDNICYVFEVLAIAGQNLLERTYGGVDDRFTAHIEGRCARCQ